MITQSLYGTLPDGRAVDVYTLDNATLQAKILTYGATLDELLVPDGKGQRANVLLTFQNLEQRTAHSACQGEVVGRFANRVAGARFELDGKEYHLTANEAGTCLHGGHEFDRAVWRAKPLGDNALELFYESPRGACGFPGAVEARVRYSLEGAALRVEYRAAASENTVLNLTNHAYFNLAAGGDILAHELRIDAEAYLPTDEISIPTGEVRPVAGTPFDFRAAKPIGRDLGAVLPTPACGYDHNFCDPKEIEVYDPASGRVMLVTTSQPGVQLYTGNHLEGMFRPRQGFCLETQAWPDAPNQAWRAQCLLEWGREYAHWTRFAFAVKS